MGARLYDLTTGRLLQVDPVFSGSANADDSVDQDPVNNSDLGGTIPVGQGACADEGGRWVKNNTRPWYGSCIPGAKPHSLIDAIGRDIVKAAKWANNPKHIGEVLIGGGATTAGLGAIIAAVAVVFEPEELVAATGVGAVDIAGYALLVTGAVIAVVGAVFFAVRYFTEQPAD